MQRLAAAYLAAKTRLDHSSINDATKASANTFLDYARAALEKHRIYAGWEFLQSFEREMVDEFKGTALRLRLESAKAEASKKLKNWRACAADEAGKSGDNAQDQELRDRLREILYHVHTQSQNEYFNIEQIKKQSRVIAVFLVGSALLLFELSNFITAGVDGIDVDAFRLGMLSGVFGGMLSVAYTVMRSDPSTRIPQLKASLGLTITRPLFGPLVTFAILMLMHQGFLSFGDNTMAALVALSFLGGFSERWFLGLVERINARATEGAS